MLLDGLEVGVAEDRGEEEEEETGGEKLRFDFREGLDRRSEIMSNSVGRVSNAARDDDG